MNLQHRVSPTAGFLAALFIMALPGAAGGQPAQPPPQQQQPPPQRQRPEQAALPVIDLSFPGGTVLDYVAALRKANPEANIVVDPEAAQIAMPPVTLRRVTVPAALAVLQRRSVNDGRTVIELSLEEVPSFSPEERPTYQVQARTSGAGRAPPPIRSTKVWTVSRLLGGDITSRKLLSAVETALEVVGSEPKPDVRFHEDTGLVIARGSAEQIEAIADVIDQLSRSLKARQEAEAQDCAKKIAVLEQEIIELRGTNLNLMARLGLLPGAEPGAQRPPGN
jgi:hypothetical protein